MSRKSLGPPFGLGAGELDLFHPTPAAGQFLQKVFSALAVQMKGVGWAFQAPVNSVMAAPNSATLRDTPRRGVGWPYVP